MRRILRRSCSSYLCCRGCRLLETQRVMKKWIANKRSVLSIGLKFHVGCYLLLKTWIIICHGDASGCLEVNLSSCLEVISQAITSNVDNFWNRVVVVRRS